MTDINVDLLQWFIRFLLKKLLVVVYNYIKNISNKDIVIEILYTKIFLKKN